jgi:hypothetical protein
VGRDRDVFLSHGFLGEEAALRPCPPRWRKGAWGLEGGRVVRVFAPALGGAAYTCKDLADSLAGKDRYEFEKFFAPRTVLTLSESVFRFIDTRQMIPV